MIVLAFIWGVICTVASAAFWFAMAMLAVIGLAIVVAGVRPSLFDRGPTSRGTPEDIRALLRSGALDAEIERVIRRNEQRRKV